MKFLSARPLVFTDNLGTVKATGTEKCSKCSNIATLIASHERERGVVSSCYLCEECKGKELPIS